MASAYVRDMLSHGLGIPCWYPNGTNGISCGDIGTFTQGSGFRKLWNLWDMDDASKAALQKVLLPDYGGEALWPERALEADAGVKKWERGESLTFNAQADYARSDSKESPSTFNVKITAREGSILPFVSPVYRFDLTQKSQLELKHFIIQHAKGLHEWTVGRHGADTPPSAPLHFVTGYYVTSACTMAGFELQETSGNICFLGRPLTSDKDGQAGSVQLKFNLWDQRETYEAMVYSGDGTMGQCLFLKGFTLLRKEEPPHDADPSAAATAESQRLIRRDLGSSVSGGVCSHCDNKLSFKSHALWLSSDQRLVGYMKENNPSNLIDRILLNQTTAAFALTHDDDWRFALKGHRWDAYGAKRVLLTVDERGPVVVKKNLAYFEDGWTDHLRSTPQPSGVRQTLKRPASASPGNCETQSGGDRPMKKRLVRPVEPFFSLLPPTEKELELAERTFRVITSDTGMIIPWHVAKKHIQCTGFSQEEFFVYLTLTRAGAWHSKGVGLTRDMLIFALRVAAFTLNAKQSWAWSTLETPGSMPEIEVLHSEDPEKPTVRLTFESASERVVMPKFFYPTAPILRYM